MSETTMLFDVSWEVGREAGGIRNLLASRAATLAPRLGDRYVMVGPWLLGEEKTGDPLDPEPALSGFEETCRELGFPVRAGRWRTPGRPLTLLVEFSRLLARKDEVLARLWERYRVDSIFGPWDYVEPVLFGQAAGLVVERWWRERGGAEEGTGVAHFHEWRAGAGLLHVDHEVPELATLFTSHGTVLGRACMAAGTAPEEAVAQRSPEEAAAAHGVRARHSLESTAARHADVYAVASDALATESRLLLGREADLVLPDGIDPEVVDARAGDVTRADAAAALRRLASRFLGRDVSGAALLATSGRGDPPLKGLDVLLDAAAALDRLRGPPVVLFLFLPAGHAGVRHEVAERLAAPTAVPGPPLGISTHHLFDAEHDPVSRRCAELGLLNQPGARVCVIHVPALLDGRDGVLDLRYEAALRGLDLTVFPAAYSHWGHSPQESLAVGVPTLVSDATGFGRWALEHEIGTLDGVHVLRRRGRGPAQVAEALREALENFLGTEERPGVADACRATAARLAWPRLAAEYDAVLERALDVARRRVEARPRAPWQPARSLPVRPPAQNVRPNFFPLEVSSTLPDALQGLERLARNLRWTWDTAALALFAELSPLVWEACRHNPLRLLREADPADLDARASDPAYLRRLDRALARLDDYVAAPPAPHPAISPERPVAYFCAEFGLHESLPLYSGGLGVLAGDHLRSASDLALPLVAVGLLYRRGFMRQRLVGGVQQVAVEDQLDPRMHALVPVEGPDGRPVEVALRLPGETVVLRAWRADVGRVVLYLLDSDVESNRPEVRVLTHHLYGGDQEHRLRQEIVLGRGGMRLLDAIGVRPGVLHLNEGHAAFAALERAALLVRDAELTFEEAREVVRATTVFTTHTPVPAGHDRFSEELVRRYFSDAPTAYGVPWEEFHALGAGPGGAGDFNMTYLALHFGGWTNAVSRAHGEVSKILLSGYCPSLPAAELPIHSVTNGVHLAAWTAPEIARLLGAEERPVTGSDFAERSESVDAKELWLARLSAKRRLLDGASAHLRRTFEERNDSPLLLARTLSGLDPDALWIGFARRFATYKRAGLVFRDPARLRRLLDRQGRPVRIFVAGKAHPRDNVATELLASIAQIARSDDFVGRVFLLPDYDISLARLLVQGVDAWLNTPRRGHEASGTSGMKAAANGVLNLSVADGWWIEGFDGRNGWTIGDREARNGLGWEDEALESELDADSLYRLLEERLVPDFFERGQDGVPQAWMERVRRCLATIPPRFDTERMVAEYRDRAYAPLAQRGLELAARDFAGVRTRSAERLRVRRLLPRVRILDASAVGAQAARVGQELQVEVKADLGELGADDVRVELVVGPRNGDGVPLRLASVRLDPVGRRRGSVQRFVGAYRLRRPGGFGYGIRVRPAASESPSLHDPVVWA